MRQRRVVHRDEVIQAFAPAREVLEAAVTHARSKTTLAQYARLHPEITREAHLKRLSGQARWMLVADELCMGLPSIDGFSVISTDANHNGGQYIFGFPGGIFTVKRQPHDDKDPDDGRYLQDALPGIKEQADLGPGIQADAQLIVYLSVTTKKATLRVCHATLAEIMKIDLADLITPTEHLSTTASFRPRARARSTRKPQDAPAKAPGASSDSD